MKIIAVDWSKNPGKRAAFQADTNKRKISRLSFDGTLEHLINYMSSSTPPVLIAIDAAIGFPASSWASLVGGGPYQSSSFIDYLLSDSLPSNFFVPVASPEDWKPNRPFIRPPPGKWSLNAFVDVSKNGIHRRVDKRLNAQPIFVTSGMPGSVGGGTRALWQELAALNHSSSFSIWPFHGSLDLLLRRGNTVIAEIYPKACYGIALSETLPSSLQPIPKTKEMARREAITKLRNTDWLSRRRVTLAGVEPAISSEDDFDALISAAALMRIFLEGAPIESSDTVDKISEGGVLGEACLTAATSSVYRAPSKRRRAIEIRGTSAQQSYPCPIPSCSHIFKGSRGGWDAHIASVRRHPLWYPDVKDADKRKELFKQAFSEWF